MIDILLALIGCSATPSAAMREPERPRERSEVGPVDAAPPARRDAMSDVIRDATVDTRAPPMPDHFDASAWEGAVVYFVMTDRFANGDPSNDGGPPCTDPESTTLFHGGDFAGLALHLDYFEELGADVLWLTPVPQQVAHLHGDQCGYHGYWAAIDDPYDGAIEPRLGGDEGLTRLIDTMHARGMRLMVDHVVNHPARGAPIVRTHPDWFHPARPDCERLGNADVYCPLSGLPDFAQERDDVATFLDTISADFTRRFAFDAIRLDTVKHVPPAYFRDRFIPAVTAERPSLYLLGELFDESGYDPQETYLATGIHGLFDFPLRRALIETFAQNASLDRVATRVQEVVTRFGIERARLRSTFLDNHDVPRFGSEMPEAEPARTERYRLALAVLFTVPGIPQLTYGDELGMLGRYPDNRRDMPAWAFDEAGRASDHDGYLRDPAGTFALTRSLIALRRSEAALSHGGYAELWRPGASGSNVYAFFRSSGDSRAIVAIHAGESTASLSMPLRGNPGIGTRDKMAFTDGVALVERLGAYPGATARVQGGRLMLSMPPRSAAVFTLE